jgi:hypothetical protein
MTTNAELGKSACRNRVLSRFGGDFSSSSGRERSQCGDHCSNSFLALSAETSGEASVRCGQQPREQRRAAPVQAGEEDELVPLHRAPS